MPRRASVAFLLPVLFLFFPGAIAAPSSVAPGGNPVVEERIDLPKVTVKGVAVCSYGLAIAGIRDHQTRRIMRLFITDVSKGSLAEERGLHAGDEIIAVNGAKVEGMDGTMKAGTPLFDLLINQPDGREIELEVIVHTTKSLRLRAGQ